MEKPRLFLGSSGKQAKLLQGLTRGLEDVARVEPWTTSFNPSRRLDMRMEYRKDARAVGESVAIAFRSEAGTYKQ